MPDMPLTLILSYTDRIVGNGKIRLRGNPYSRISYAVLQTFCTMHDKNDVFFQQMLTCFKLSFEIYFL